MAMIRNMDISIAVATKPKEMALMDVPKLFHGASRSNPVCDGLGSEPPLYMFHGFDDLSELSSLIVLGGVKREAAEELLYLYIYENKHKQKELAHLNMAATALPNMSLVLKRKRF